MTSDGARAPIATDAAPAALGPYSQAIAHGGVLYCSGQLPVDPATGALERGAPAAQTTRCLENLQAVCRAGGTDLSAALRLAIYTTDLGAFAEINEAYGSFFAADPPARVTLGVASLPKDAQVEIDAIVALG